MNDRSAALQPAPWLSVVIPAHDRGEFLLRAVSSVLAQATVDPNFEVVVVDDASEIPARETLAGITDPRLRVVRSEVNIERGSARNLGTREARAPLVAFLDCDDEWLPDKLSRQMPQAPARGASVTGVVPIDASGRRLAGLRLPPSDAHRRIACGNGFIGAPSSLVIDKESFDSVGGFPEEAALQGAEDWILLVRLIRTGVPLRVVPFAGVLYRVHSGNSSANSAWLGAAIWAGLEQMGSQGLIPERELAAARQYNAVMIARQYAHKGRRREAAAWVRRAWRVGSPLGALWGTSLVLGSGLAVKLPNGRS